MTADNKQFAAGYDTGFIAGYQCGLMDGWARGFDAGTEALAAELRERDDDDVPAANPKKA